MNAQTKNDSKDAISVFLRLKALPAWLSLPRSRRREIVATDVMPVVARFPSLRVRWFDAEAFDSAQSDIVLLEGLGPRDHNHLMEGLRDSPLFAAPYFEMVGVHPTFENGYEEYERETPAP